MATSLPTPEQAAAHLDRQLLGRYAPGRVESLIEGHIVGGRMFAEASGQPDPFGVWTAEGDAAFRNRRALAGTTGGQLEPA